MLGILMFVRHHRLQGHCVSGGVGADVLVLVVATLIASILIN
jgi:hypothetical protein